VRAAVELSRGVVTGVSGTIGSVLVAGLAELDLVPLDLPRWDLRRDDLRPAFEGADTMIHLAWDPRADGFGRPGLDPANTTMTLRVYQAAAESGATRRVIMASSVHTDRYRSWSGPELLSPTEVP
jgi:nucleoside-diphosphate-sugar epimerase